MAKPRPKSMQHYPIRDVARMTGLSLDTLRAWERRYHAVVPGRSDRKRLYSDADVSRLKQLAQLVGRGHAIGTIAGLPDDELARLLEGADAHTDLPAPVTVASLEPLVSALDLALLTASAGYGVVYLGADLPADDIAHAATTAGAHVVRLSLTTPGGCEPCGGENPGESPPGVELWIGGPESRWLLSAAGDRGRYVDGLAAVIPMLSRHAR